MKKLFRVYFEKIAYVDVEAESALEAEDLAMNTREFTYEDSWQMTDATEETDGL